MSAPVGKASPKTDMAKTLVMSTVYFSSVHPIERPNPAGAKLPPAGTSCYFLSPGFLGGLIALIASVGGCLRVVPLSGRLFLCVASICHASVKIVSDLF